MIADFTADVGQSRRTKHAKSRTSKHLSSIFHGFPTPLVDFSHTLQNYPLEEIPEKEEYFITIKTQTHQESIVIRYHRTS